MMASRYTDQVAYSALFLAPLANWLTVHPIAGQPAEGTTAHEQFQCANIDRPRDFTHFKKILNDCTKLTKYYTYEHPDEYPDELNRCVCTIFIDRSFTLYWLSLSQPYIAGLASAVAGNSSDPEGLFDDRLSELDRLSPDDLKRLDNNRYGKESKRTVENDFMIVLCVSLLERTEPISLVWDVLTNFHQLTGDITFGRGIFNVTNKPLKDLLVQRGFCKVELDLKVRVDSSWKSWIGVEHDNYVKSHQVPI